MPTPEGKPTIVIGAQLRKARELLGLTTEETAREINVDPIHIDDWEGGTSEPNLQQIESLANIYGREIDYFLKVTPNPPAKIKFRGKPGQSLRNLPKDTKVTLAKFDESCRAAVEFEGLLSKKREVKLQTFSTTLDPITGAQMLRDRFALGDNPIPDLRTLLEDSGVRVFVMTIPDDGLSGFSFWHEEYGPCIFVHAKDIPGRRNFTLAHELGHLVYKHGSSACYIPSEICPPQEKIERKANQFAVELLLPRNGVVLDVRKRNLSKEPSEKQLGQMASRG
jgi:transcriptional regulator with XRE-family HTH domain